MNRLVATEGRDKGGKLALTSRSNAKGGGCGKEERKNGKAKHAGNLDSVSSCDDGLVRVRSFATTYPSVVCLRRHHDEDISISSSVSFVRFSTKGSDTLSRLASMIFDFLLGVRRKKENSNEDYIFLYNRKDNVILTYYTCTITQADKLILNEFIFRSCDHQYITIYAFQRYINKYYI